MGRTKRELGTNKLKLPTDSLRVSCTYEICVQHNDITSQPFLTGNILLLLLDTRDIHNKYESKNA